MQDKNLKKEYHILSLSGGKDSTALAFFIKENMPEVFEDLELVFFDTECELEETYQYLNKIELFLNKPIDRIKPTKTFDHLYQVHNILPSAMKRWCTVELKTKTFRKYMHDKLKDCGDSKVFVYIGIRADESHRAESNKKYPDSGIIEVHPFIESGLAKDDINNIITNCGIGLPDYYKWRSRSGCYFCFFQRKIEWIGLYEKHPDLFEKAMAYEEDGAKRRTERKGMFTWCQDTSLRDLIKPDNIKRIKEVYQNKLEKNKKFSSLMELVENEEFESNCKLCHL